MIYLQLASVTCMCKGTEQVLSPSTNFNDTALTFSLLCDRLFKAKRIVGFPCFHKPKERKKERYRGSLVYLKDFAANAAIF